MRCILVSDGTTVDWCIAALKLIKIGGPLPRKDLVALVEALKANRSTTGLDLDGCGIGDEGMQLMRDLVLANKRIGELDLQLNQITDAGVKLLADAVPQSGLLVIHLSNNTVTCDGTRALLEAAVCQHKLTGRMLNICGISEAIMASARQQLQQHRKSTSQRDGPGHSPQQSQRASCDASQADKLVAAASATNNTEGCAETQEKSALSTVVPVPTSESHDVNSTPVGVVA